jgi:K+-sensing histidine kinase KdpD
MTASPVLASFSDEVSLLSRLEKRQGERRQDDRRDGTPDDGSAPTQELSADGLRQLCHDMRQPLATIAALAVVLDAEAGPSLSAARRRRLSQITQETTRLSAFVTNYLAGPRPAPVELGRVVQRAVTSAMASFRGCLELTVEGQLVVHGDSVLLERAVANVLDNACRFAGPGGLVRVAVRCDVDGVRVDIDDDGPGLGPTSPSGYGMGLVIVRSVLTSHGGDVEVIESDLGGARVRLRLPFPLPLQLGRDRA